MMSVGYFKLLKFHPDTLWVDVSITRSSGSWELISYRSVASHVIRRSARLGYSRKWPTTNHVKGKDHAAVLFWGKFDAKPALWLSIFKEWEQRATCVRLRWAVGGVSAIQMLGLGPRPRGSGQQTVSTIKSS
jgi:hypothetical protein